MGCCHLATLLWLLWGEACDPATAAVAGHYDDVLRGGMCEGSLGMCRIRSSRSMANPNPCQICCCSSLTYINFQKISDIFLQYPDCKQYWSRDRLELILELVTSNNRFWWQYPSCTLYPYYRFVSTPYYQVENNKACRQVLKTLYPGDCLFTDVFDMIHNKVSDKTLLKPRNIKFKKTCWCESHEKYCSIPDFLELLLLLGCPCVLFSRFLGLI